MPIVINEMDIHVEDAPAPRPLPAAEPAPPGGAMPESPGVLNRLHEGFATADRRDRLTVE